MEDILNPNGICVRIKFEPAVAEFLRRLSEQLQTNTEGEFFLEQAPNARQSVGPFHIKLISSSNLTGSSCRTVSGILKDAGPIFESVRGQVLPVCVVDGDGLVSLKISSSDCVVLGQHISRQLFHANGWCPAHEANLLVSIGVFRGPHTAEFETWLNGELRSNSAEFPFFQSEVLELSGNFMQEAVILSRNGLRDHDPVSDAQTLPSVRTILNERSANHNVTAVQITQSAQSAHPVEEAVIVKDIKDKNSIEQRLLAAAASITQKISGEGVVRSMGQTREVNKFSITPVDLSQWRQQCSKVIQMLEQMMLTVGPKVRCTY